MFKNRRTKLVSGKTLDVSILCCLGLALWWYACDLSLQGIKILYSDKWWECTTFSLHSSCRYGLNFSHWSAVPPDWREQYSIVTVWPGRYSYLRYPSRGSALLHRLGHTAETNLAWYGAHLVCFLLMAYGLYFCRCFVRGAHISSWLFDRAEFNMFGKYTLVGMLLTFWVWHIAELLYEHRTYDVWMHNYDLTENGPICFESFIINCLDHVIRWRVSTKRGMVVKSLRSLAGTLLLRDNVVHVLPGQGSEDVEVLPDGTAIFSSVSLFFVILPSSSNVCFMFQGLNYMRNPVLKNVPGRMMMFDFKRPAEPAIELRLLEFKVSAR